MKNVPPKVGTEWRVNFFRMDMPAGTPQAGTGWSPPMVGDFHALDKFGVLVFGDDKGAGAERGRARREPAKKADATPSDAEGAKKEPTAPKDEPARRTSRRAARRRGRPRSRAQSASHSNRSTSAMDELLDVLLPSRRAGPPIGELRPSTRIYLALFVLGVTVAAGVRRRLAVARAGRTRAHAATATQRARRAQPIAAPAARLHRCSSSFVGAYLAVEVAPLPARLERCALGRACSCSARWWRRGCVIHLVGAAARPRRWRTSAAGARAARARVRAAGRRRSPRWRSRCILVIVVAKHFGKDVTSLVAALGVGSLAIGLAAQQTLGNMIAGFVLLVDRPFRPGDRIKLAIGRDRRGAGHRRALDAHPACSTATC